ncbi:MAG: Crp/Fnr family transcriptional regulator [Pseudonocardiaceae bacterium]
MIAGAVHVSAHPSHVGRGIPAQTGPTRPGEPDGSEPYCVIGEPITPGTIFGEMVLLGQRMYDNYAEALDESVVCVMGRDDVHRFLLSDPRIATRITAILGARLLEMERRLCDTVFKSVPQRVAATLATEARGFTIP